VVWQRILTSPDSSSLAILKQDRRLGFVHLITSVADSLNQGSATNAPEGMVRDITVYRLDVSGSIDDLGNGAGLRFDGEITLSQQQQWEQLELQIISRPLFIALDSVRSEGLLHIKIDGPDVNLERAVRLDSLSHPEALVSTLLDPTALFALDVLPFPMPDPSLVAHSAGLQWSASTDFMKLGNSSSQVYRLDLEPMDGMPITLLVSRAGEILRVDLPHNLILVNEALTGL
jgi:hypothetical protein